MDRACLACGGSLEGEHQLRKYCDDACKKRFQRGARADSSEDAPSGADGIDSTEAATMLALAEVGKLGTPSGQAVLVLARRIDRSHRDTGAGLASMVNRLQQTLEALTKNAGVVDDPVDELTRRRAEKLRAASSG